MIVRPPAVPLAELMGHLPTVQSGTSPALLIRGVSYDSRAVQPGDLFVCLRGGRHDGHAHAAEAARRGAVALVVERPVQGLDGLFQISVPDTRRELPRLAARFYGEPSARLHMTGVTGTEGKTTTVYLLDAILRAAGCRTGRFGTVANAVGSRTEPARLTTPESVDLQRLLWECVQAGVSHVAMEVTSHALAQGRVDRCEFDQAVFTNLHSDHLDFHRTLEAYRAAKAVLFGELGRGSAKAGRGTGVVNADDPQASYMRRVCSRPVVGFGLSRLAQVRGRLLAATLDRTVFHADTPQGGIEVALPLPGPFNVPNALAAIAAAATSGVDLHTIKRGLEQAGPVPGRLEPVPNARGLRVVIDFAHTEAAYQAVLSFLRQTTAGRLITVFGCPGDRDRTKRPVIGRLVTALSDLAIMTTDNPAHEDPADIAEAIARGARTADPKRDRHDVRLDRHEAIRHAIRLARSGDTVLLAGKGHEDFQLVGDIRLPFSDRAAAEEALGAIGEGGQADRGHVGFPAP